MEIQGNNAPSLQNCQTDGTDRSRNDRPARLSRLQCQCAAACRRRGRRCLPRWTSRPIRPRCMARAALRGASSRRRGATWPRWSAARPDHVVFTSGATEAAATLLTPDWRMGRGAAAHVAALRLGGRSSLPAEWRAFRGRRRSCASASTATACADLDALQRRWPRMTAPTACRWSPSMLANNETGVIQPIARDRRARARRPAACWWSTRCRRRAAFRSILQTARADYPDPVVAQDRRAEGRRRHRRGVRPDDAGAADHAAAGRKAAIAPARKTWPASPASARRQRMAATALARCRRVAAMRDRHRSRSCASWRPDAEIFGRGAPRACQHDILLAVPGLKAETAQIAFDLAGVALSAGSACSSGKVGSEPCAEGDGLRRPRARCASRSAHATRGASRSTRLPPTHATSEPTPAGLAIGSAACMGAVAWCRGVECWSDEIPVRRTI